MKRIKAISNEFQLKDKNKSIDEIDTSRIFGFQALIKNNFSNDSIISELGLRKCKKKLFLAYLLSKIIVFCYRVALRTSCLNVNSS